MYIYMCVCLCVYVCVCVACVFFLQNLSSEIIASELANKA